MAAYGLGSGQDSAIFEVLGRMNRPSRIINKKVIKRMYVYGENMQRREDSQLRRQKLKGESCINNVRGRNDRYDREETICRTTVYNFKRC